MLVRDVAARSSRFRWLQMPGVLDYLFILLSLAGFIAMLAALGALGFGVGLNVRPLGEDYNWINMLQRGAGADAARIFWEGEQRNPLSPWWYIAARPVIFGFDAGLLALRYGVSLLLASCAYYLVIVVTGRGSRPFALCLAMLVVFWAANRYPGQIYWNFEGALAASLLSVATYVQFVKGGRLNYLLYAGSLLLWFLAFATYTLQCGAALAIGYAAFRIGPSGCAHPSRLGRLGSALFDVLPYVALFALYFLIWETAMGTFASTNPLHFSVSAFLRSLEEGVWHSDVLVFYLWVMRSPDYPAFIVSAVICSGLAFIALQWRETFSDRAVPGIGFWQIVDVLVIIALIAAPTVALESSSERWPPGTRWPMIYQLTGPALLLSLMTVLVTLAPRRLRARMWHAGVAVAIGVGVLFSLGHNWVQTELTKREKLISDNLRRLVAEDFAAGREAPRHVLVLLDKSNRAWWQSSDSVMPTMASVWFHRDDVSFRVVPWKPAPLADWISFWTLKFGRDSDGVSNAKPMGGDVPYDRIDILSVDGLTASRVTSADRADFAGWEVQWNRTEPIKLPAVDSAQLCPLVWSSDHDALLDGWSVGERDHHGPVRWTTSRSARITLPNNCRGRTRLRIVAAYVLSPQNIEGLKLRINGRELNYRRSTSDGNYILQAEVDERTIGSDPLLNIELQVPHLDTLPDDRRAFGVAVRRVEISEIQD